MGWSYLGGMELGGSLHTPALHLFGQFDWDMGLPDGSRCPSLALPPQALPWSGLRFGLQRLVLQRIWDGARRWLQ